MPKISDKTRWFEIAAVVLTGVLKFVLMDGLNLRFLYISMACSFWLVYVVYKAVNIKGILVYWGFTQHNFKKTFLELLPVGAVSVVIFFLLGNHLGKNILNWNILPILVIYPIWGVVQQFIIVGLISRNLADMKKFKLPIWSIVVITSIVFATVHFPYYHLVLGTFLLAVVYTILYLRGRNLIVLGIYHGWMGAFFFYTVMGRDAWQEVFGKLVGAF